MRYRGQGHEIMVPIANGTFGPESGDQLAGWFAEAYRTLFSRTIPKLSVEVMTWTLSLATDRSTAEITAAVPERYRPEPESRRRLFDPAGGAWVEADVYARDRLRPGATLSGPAIIVEDETTTLVTNGFGATVNARGQIVMTKEGESA